MDLLFLDTYYVNGEESLINLYNIFKDFLVPVITIVFSILVTLHVTKKDRAQNAKNRKEDFEKAEQEKLNAINSSIAKEIERKNQVLTDLEFFNKSALINLEQHLITINRLLKRLNFDKLPTFSIQVFSNEYINSIMSLNFNDIRPYMEQEHYVKYINAVKLIEGLYSELDRLVSDYRKNHYQLHRELDIVSHRLFFYIQKSEFDKRFNRILLNDLLKFKADYDDYVKNYSSIYDDPTYASVFDNLKSNFINENFMIIIDQYPELKTIVLDFECVLVSLERLVNYYYEALKELHKGLDKNFQILKSFKITDRPIELSRISPEN